MRVHLGAGDKYWPGWVNVDIEGDQDVIADIMDLPFDDGSVDEIQAIHVFEHIHRLDIPSVLKEWKRVLKQDGKLVLEMPSLDKITENLHNGEQNTRLTVLGLFGDPRYRNPHMEHKWCWSQDELAEQMKASGFNAQFTDPNFHYQRRDLRCVAIQSPQEK